MSVMRTPTAIATIPRFRRSRTRSRSSCSTAIARSARAGPPSCCATIAAGRYRLLCAQSPLGRALYRHYGLDPQDYETNILLADGVAWFKSEGSIRMAEGLGFPWRLAAVFRILPLAWRDRLYETVARNRLRWFGKRATCYLPDPRFADRFIA